MTLPEQHLNRYDLPAVWATVFLEKFFSLPWPGVAAFLAAVYTLCRLIGMARKWWRGK